MSLASRLYAASPVWLQNTALTAYGWRLRSRRYGGIHSAVLAELLREQWHDRDEIETSQLTRLNHAVAAARVAPLYANKGLPDRPLQSLEDLRTLPLVEKAELRQPRHRLVAESQSRRLLEIHTGGTTGTPLSIYCDRAVLQRNYAFFERFRRWAGIEPGEAVATFAGRTILPAGQERPPFWRRNAAGNAWLFSSYHLGPDTLSAYVTALTRIAPALIDSYPSNLAILARYMLDQGISSVRPRAIITSSETLLPSVRDLIERAFACAVFDHYGAAEMAALITQCDHGSYHVNPEFGIVEILRDGVPVAAGERGEIVATGFINPIMPLIRYRTGDSAVAGGSRCACGRAFPTIERLEGRMDDYLITPEGYVIGRLDPVFKSATSILETRIVQDDVDHVRVELVPGSGYVVEQGESIVTELQKRLGPNMRIDLELVSSLPRTTGGKLRAVVNLVKPSSQVS